MSLRSAFRFRLRTLLVCAAVLPPLIAAIIACSHLDGPSFFMAVTLGIVFLTIAWCVVCSLERAPSHRWRHVLHPQTTEDDGDRLASEVPARAPELVTARITDLEGELRRATLLIQSLADACVEKGVLTPAEIAVACEQLTPPIVTAPNHPTDCDS